MVKKIAFSCYVDAKEKFEREALRWAWSLQSLIGADSADIHVTCNPDVSADFRTRIESIDGINLHYESPFIKMSPPANKWLQLKALVKRRDDYSHFVLSDCDKVFVSFSEGWLDDSVRACKFVPRPTFSVFESLFEKHFTETPRFLLDRPDPRDKAKDSRNYVNNHNGGLLLVPANKIQAISDLWHKWILTLMEDAEVFGDNLRNLDQVAFALAMHELGEDISFLPKTLDIGMNVATLSPHVAHRSSGQLVLHIHGNDNQDGTMVYGEGACQSLKDIVSELNQEYLAWRSAKGMDVNAHSKPRQFFKSMLSL